MPAVPDRFWIVDPEPRPVPVTSVTPRRIYLSLDGRQIELDRRAYVEHGAIEVVGAPDDAPTLATSREDAARGSLFSIRRDLDTAEARVEALRGEIRALKERLRAAKAERKRLREDLAAADGR